MTCSKLCSGCELETSAVRYEQIALALPEEKLYYSLSRYDADGVCLLVRIVPIQNCPRVSIITSIS